MSEEKSCSCSYSCPARPVGENPDLAAAGHDLRGPVTRSVFRIPGMDCPSEEQMIRLRLADAGVLAMAFDLPGRTLSIDHVGDPAGLLRRLEPLGYGAELRETRPLQTGDNVIARSDDAAEARVLWTLLAINAAMFIIEIVAGWWAQSAGLISDAADMLADAAVYGVALYAVGRDSMHKLLAARLSGLLQLVLAVGALTETGRRVVVGSTPEEIAMIWISMLALTANVVCLALVSRYREGGVHMRASYIFSANDVLANLGVIVAGMLVVWTGSPWPDWMIGFAIGIMVLTGAIRILRLK